MVSDPSPRKQIHPFPYLVYLAGVLALALAGLAVSIYLAISHYRNYTDIGYQSFCALSKAINCDTVSQSPYSIFGPLPVAVWGVAGYSLFLALIFFAALPSGEHRRVWTLCLADALVFSLFSLIFAWISSFRIGSYCILCIATYGINLLLVYFSWIIRRRFRAEPLRPAFVQDVRFLWRQRRLSLPLFAAFGTGMLAILLTFPAYWQISPPMAAEPIKTGVTAEGQPWVGAENPVLEITEFSDYQCFQCRKMHYYLRTLVARHPDKIRLIHCNYPMDHEINPIVKEPFHVGSGQMALLAVHGVVNGKFLEMNDLLFAKGATGQRIRLKEIAEETGMDLQQLAAALTYEPYQRHLSSDIRRGMKLRIVGTPSYLINGSVYEGNIPAEILEPFLKDGKS
jgi:uncharacterized membrane protein/protein-disulfide isomerase